LESALKRKRKHRPITGLIKTNIYMRNLKACLFDLDGVLVDTAVYHFKAWRRLAQSLGIEFTEHDNERLKGVSRVRSLEIILEIGGKSLPPEQMLALCEQKNTEYLLDVAKMTPDEILPGVVDFLKALKADGFKIALGSASKNAQLILERTAGRVPRRMRGV
jgi:beta-phosphoglucomutase